MRVKNMLRKIVNRGLIILALITVLPITIGYSTLILEAIMLIAFGSSWLVKGEAILKDIK